MSLVKFVPGAIVLLFSSHSGQSQPDPQTTTTITSPRPLADLADRLEAQYRTIVTYEESMLLFRGDLGVYGKDVNAQGGLGPKMRSFRPPLISAPRLNLSTLEAVVESFNQQNDLPSFRVAASKYGLHILPARVRDTQGHVVAATSLLDSTISVPSGTRSPWQTFEAICQAVGEKAGIRLQPFFPLIAPSFDEIFTAGEEPKISSGVNGANARDALIDFLGRSATTLSWRLNCAPSARVKDQFCVLSVTTIPISSTDSSGRRIEKPLLYDRCGACPKVRRPPPPPPH